MTSAAGAGRAAGGIGGDAGDNQGEAVNGNGGGGPDISALVEQLEQAAACTAAIQACRLR